MNDLISRQMAVDAICKEWCNCSHDDCENKNMMEAGFDPCDGCSDVDAIMDLPSAQPERKPGKWLIREFGDDAQCSECGMYFKDAYDVDNSDHYCRHCGAKMKGVKAIR